MVLGFTKQGLCPCGLTQLRKKTWRMGKWKETGNTCNRCEINLVIDGLASADVSSSTINEYIASLKSDAQKATELLKEEEEAHAATYEQQLARMQMALEKENEAHAATYEQQLARMQMALEEENEAHAATQEELTELQLMEDADRHALRDVKEFCLLIVDGVLAEPFVRYGVGFIRLIIHK